MAKICAEDIIQITVMDFCRFHKLDKFIFHCANERTTTPQAGALLKRKGVLSGVSDILILKPSKSYHGAAIELKSKNGKLSANQQAFLDILSEHGYFTTVCYSADEAIGVICTYLNITPPHKPPHAPSN
jgi:hypothetical protein